MYYNYYQYSLGHKNITIQREIEKYIRPRCNLYKWKHAQDYARWN